MKKLAHLAALHLSPDEMAHYAPELTNMLQFIEQMNTVDTTTIAPLTHPLDLAQRLREDKVTESNDRDKYQAIAPETEAGLYLVPKVIEDATS